MSAKKSYLGDSVYADIWHDGYSVVLTTENGRASDPSNTIVLEPSVYAALKLYVEQLVRLTSDTQGESA